MHFAAIYSLDHKSSGAAMCAKQGMRNEEERDISDYLDNTESSITVMWMALSKAVKVRKGTIPMAVHPHKCKCAVYVGQGETRLLPHKSNTRSWLSPSLFLSASTRVRGKDGTFWSCSQCMLEPYEQEDALGWAGKQSFLCFLQPVWGEVLQISLQNFHMLLCSHVDCRSV